MSNYFDREAFRVSVAIATGSLYTSLSYQYQQETLVDMLKTDAEIVSAFRTLEWQLTGEPERLTKKSREFPRERALELLQQVFALLNDQSEEAGVKLAICGSLLSAIIKHWDKRAEE